jgi:hypothetical protein
MKAGAPFVGAAFRHSQTVKRIINEMLVANGGDKYVSFRKFGAHNRLLLNGFLGARIKHTVKRRLRAFIDQVH